MQRTEKRGPSREEGAGSERDKDFFPDLEGEGRRLSWKNILTVLAPAPGSSGPPLPSSWTAGMRGW